jgi:lysozyme
MMIPQKHRNKAAALAIAATIGVGFEGMRHTVYRDVVGVPTYCIGETKNPHFGHVYSTQECMTIYEGRLEEFQRGVEKAVRVDMPAAREAAAIDLAYNIGLGGFDRSSVARDLNAGRVSAACDDFLKFNRAGGIVFPGLTRRREKERALCLDGE